MLNDLRAGRDENSRESGNTITILMNTTHQSPSQSTQRQGPSILFLLTRFLESQVSSTSRPSLHQLPHSGNPNTKTIRVFPPQHSMWFVKSQPGGIDMSTWKKNRQSQCFQNNVLRIPSCREMAHTYINTMLFAFQHQTYFHRSSQSMRFVEAKAHTPIAH